jgi:hypothetical protein
MSTLGIVSVATRSIACISAGLVLILWLIFEPEYVNAHRVYYTLSALGALGVASVPLVLRAARRARRQTSDGRALWDVAIVMSVIAILLLVQSVRVREPMVEDCGFDGKMCVQ